MFLQTYIVVLYFVAFMDRVNMTFAVLMINKDVELTPAFYGLGAGIFLIGYKLFRVRGLMFMASLRLREENAQ